jgi:hypothetical protein
MFLARPRDASVTHNPKHYSYLPIDSVACAFFREVVRFLASWGSGLLNQLFKSNF